jgi:hypothetical protein
MGFSLQCGTPRGLFLLKPRTLQMATNDRSMTVLLKNSRTKILENKQIYLVDSVGCQSQNAFVLVLVSGSPYLCIFISRCLYSAVYVWIIYLAVFFWLYIFHCLYMAVFARLPISSCLCLDAFSP